MNLPEVIQKSPDTRINLVSAFLSGRNQKTIEAYRADLADFAQFTEEHTLDGAAMMLLSGGHGHANGLALAYKTSLIERGLSPATVNRRLASLRSMVKIARILGIVPYALEVENMKSQSYRDTKGPGRDGYRNMLDHAKKQKDRKAIRDTAILHLLFDLGLRRGEVVSLDFLDVDLERGLLAILGKGRTQKEYLTMPVQTKDILRDWIESRGNDPGPLFINLDHAKQGSGRLTGTGLYKIVRDLGEKNGIKTRPHGLRHAAITEALDLTRGDVRAVAKFSRHRNLQTLTLYDDNRKDIAGNVAQMITSSVYL